MDADKLFGTTDLYQILQIKPTTSINEGENLFSITIKLKRYLLYKIYICISFLIVKKSYYKLAKIHHPDKNSDVNKSTADAKFHIIHQAYLILSNAESRKKYDEGGCKVLFAKTTVAATWENHLKIITEKNILDASASYKNSAEEKTKILHEFVEGKGSITHILNTVPFTRKEDEPSIIATIQKAIENKEIQQLAIKKLPKGY